MLAEGPRAIPHQSAFPWWYSIVKWALPMTISFAVAAWLGLAITGMISAPYVLSTLGLGSALTGVESVGTISFLAMMVGTAASMAGLFTSLMIRGAVLFNLVENNLTIVDSRCDDLEQRISAVTTELRQIHRQRDDAHAQLLTEHGHALRTLGQYEGIAGQAPTLRQQAGLEPQQPQPQQQELGGDQQAAPAAPPPAADGGGGSSPQRLN